MSWSSGKRLKRRNKDEQNDMGRKESQRWQKIKQAVVDSRWPVPYHLGFVQLPMATLSSCSPSSGPASFCRPWRSVTESFLMFCWVCQTLTKEGEHRNEGRGFRCPKKNREAQRPSCPLTSIKQTQNDRCHPISSPSITPFPSLCHTPGWRFIVYCSVSHFKVALNTAKLGSWEMLRGMSASETVWRGNPPAGQESKSSLRPRWGLCGLHTTWWMLLIKTVILTR